MNILVTGGAGFIGSHTLIELMAAGHSEVVVDTFQFQCGVVAAGGEYHRAGGAFL